MDHYSYRGVKQVGVKARRSNRLSRGGISTNLQQRRDVLVKLALLACRQVHEVTRLKFSCMCK